MDRQLQNQQMMILKRIKILYKAMSNEHKEILKKIMQVSSTEYDNVKILEGNLMYDANLLRECSISKNIEM